ncbi:MAG: BrnT family toxin [Candidatus Woesebacteria bacterium]
MISLKEPVEFEWDEANQDKNWKKHKVSISEAEEVFLDKRKKISKDFFHSETEDRYILIGMTKSERALLVIFTRRKDKVRVISARDLNKREQFLLHI